MRIPGTFRALSVGAALVVVALLGVPPAMLATHQPTAEDVVAVATGTYNMSCASATGGLDCTAFDPDLTWSELAAIRPGSGPLKGVGTEVTVFSLPLDPFFNGWHRTLQGVACAPDRITDAQLGAFVDTVTSRRTDGTDGPVTIADECTLSGGLRITTNGSVTEYTYWIQSAMVVPPATATPTAKPTRRPTPRPTASPTAGATAAVTSTPSASANQTLSPSPTPTQAASATATPTTEQSVLAGNPSPTPSAVPPAGPAGPPSRPPRGALVASLTPLGDVSLDPVALGGSAALAILLLLFMAFTSELFNDTFEANYDEIAGWLHLRRRGDSPPGRFSRLWTSPLGIGLFLAVGAAVYVLLDPGVTLNADALATYVGMFAGLGLVLTAFEVPGLLIYRRRTGASAGVRALPWTLPAAVICVAVSRFAALEPGYLYGIVIGLVFREDVNARDEGRQNAAGAAWTLLVALAAWVALDWLRAGDNGVAPFASLLLETALAVVVVGGLEAVAFGLLPMRFLAGQAVYAWSRWRWALLFGISSFAFIHLLIGPHTGYLSQLSPGALAAAVGAFAAFGAFSVLFWAYFRFRPART